jgi:hypothetical protein
VFGKSLGSKHGTRYSLTTLRDLQEPLLGLLEIDHIPDSIEILKRRFSISGKATEDDTHVGFDVFVLARPRDASQKTIRRPSRVTTDLDVKSLHHVDVIRSPYQMRHI